MKRLMLIAVLLTSLGGAHAMEAMTAGELAGGAVAGGFAVYRLVGSIFDVNKILHGAGYEGTLIGLGKLDRDTALTVAKDADRGAAVLLTLLPNTAAQNAQEINDLIIKEFGADPWILSFLQSVAPTLERYVPFVGFDPLSDKGKGYLISFIQGVKDGADDYLSSNGAAVKLKAKYTTTKQHDHERKKMKFKSAVGWFVPSVASEKPTAWPKQDKN